MQFNKSKIYELKEKTPSWGDFVYWADIERIFVGRWDKLKFDFALVKVQQDFINLTFRKFISQFGLLYPKQIFKKDILYRLYGKAEKVWMYVGKVLFGFYDSFYLKFKFLNSLFSQNSLIIRFRSSLFASQGVKFLFLSSVFSRNNLFFRFLNSCQGRFNLFFKFISSLFSRNTSFLLGITVVSDKDAWNNFQVWMDMTIAKNDFWSG